MTVGFEEKVGAGVRLEIEVEVFFSEANHIRHFVHLSLNSFNYFL